MSTPTALLLAFCAVMCAVNLWLSVTGKWDVRRSAPAASVQLAEPFPPLVTSALDIVQAEASSAPAAPSTARDRLIAARNRRMVGMPEGYDGPITPSGL